MAGTLFSGCTAKKIFTHAFIATYKDYGVSQIHLSNWIKLTLYFEDPTKTLKRGMLFNRSIPKYSEIFQTGICLFGFGFQTRQIVALRRYWQHEWIITAILGRQTVDHYSHSPLVKYHDHSHITDDLINCSIKKFLGEIKQVGSGPLNCATYTKIQQDELNQNPFVDSEMNTNFEEFLYEGDHNPTPRIKQCYSIEVLERNDREIKFHIISDALFNCRAFVRDFGMDINCMSSIYSLHLAKLGPVHSEQALKKHELHYEQLVKSAKELTPICNEYMKKLRQQYPDASASYRFI